MDPVARRLNLLRNKTKALAGRIPIPGSCEFAKGTGADGGDAGGGDVHRTACRMVNLRVGEVIGRVERQAAELRVQERQHLEALEAGVCSARLPSQQQVGGRVAGQLGAGMQDGDTARRFGADGRAGDVLVELTQQDKHRPARGGLQRRA